MTPFERPLRERTARQTFGKRITRNYGPITDAPAKAISSSRHKRKRESTPGLPEVKATAHPRIRPLSNPPAHAHQRVDSSSTYL